VTALYQAHALRRDPPYFVALAFAGKVNQSPAVAVVHDTVSGKTLATIKPSICGS